MKISRWWIVVAALPLLIWPLVSADTQATSNLRTGNASPGSGQAVTFYVTIKGTRQGVFKGDVPGANHRDQIVGLRFSFEGTAAHDTATGQATGKRQYSAVLFTKEWGASSPQLFTALAQAPAGSISAAALARAFNLPNLDTSPLRPRQEATAIKAQT